MYKLLITIRILYEFSYGNASIKQNFYFIHLNSFD